MARKNEPGTALFEDARIIFRNFEGREEKYNAAGSRNFSVLVDEATADQMARDGWNIKTLPAREEGDVSQPYIQVSIRFDIFPPKIVILTSRGRNYLNEETVGMLDWASIEKVDLMLRPFVWEVNGETGIKAYLKTMYVTIEEDYLEQKYDAIPGGESVAEGVEA